MMPSSRPYAITEVLRDTDQAELVRCVRGADNRPVIVAIPHREGEGRDELARLEREYEIALHLDVPGVLHPIALDRVDGRTALVLEDFAGRPLAESIGPPFNLAVFLRRAIDIATIVADIHDRGVVHRDIKPDNVLIEQTTGAMRLTGFGIASIGLESQGDLRVQGSLAYMAPEQTGRLHRVIDGRTDLYSLGVTLYQLLTGVLPFEAHDAPEWIYAHLARTPVPPSEILPELPAVVSRIVLKLLAKAPEERYQTARGLLSDLQRCLSTWSDGTVPSFTLAERDVPNRLGAPRGLYGRERELAELTAAVNRVRAGAHSELVLVSGPPGVGKSSLVMQLKATSARRETFLSAKFDQYQSRGPYSTIAMAFRDPVLDILSKSESEVASWRERLRDALGRSAQLVVDVIPEVELIIGKQANPPTLPLAEAEARFHLVIRQFLSVWATGEHALVLFIDDLQWADSASVTLLAEMVGSAETRLLVIAAYRSTEVGPAHALSVAVERMRAGGAAIEEIVLAPLPLSPLTALVADLVRGAPAEVRPLAELVQEKTAGNPFFAVQFLTSLHEMGLLSVAATTSRWDIDEIRTQGVTENVVDLLVGRIESLSGSTRELLEICACLGTSWSLEIATIASGRTTENIIQELTTTTIETLIVREGDVFRFHHDRIQQAIYAGIAESRRRELSLQIARILLARAGPVDVEARIFDIVGAFRLGLELLVDPPERIRVAELQLIAGRRAKRATAYRSAAEYLATGVDLLPDGCWQSAFALTHALYLERVGAELMLGSFDVAASLLETLRRESRTVSEKIAVFRAEIDLHVVTGELERAVETGFAALELFGIALPRRPTADDANAVDREIREELGDRTIESLIDLPILREPETEAALQLLGDLLPPAYFVAPRLHFMLASRMVLLALRHGVSGAAALGLCAFGHELGASFRRWQDGDRFGSLAHELTRKHRFVEVEARVLHLLGATIRPWTQPLPACIQVLREALGVAWTAGDITYVTYSSAQIVIARLACGEPLDDVAREIDSLLETRGGRFSTIADTVLTVQAAFVRELRGLPPAQGSPAALDESTYRQLEAGMPLLRFWREVRRVALGFLSGNLEDAVSAEQRCTDLTWTSRAQVIAVDHHFYGALALAAADSDALDAGTRQLRLARLAAHRDFLRSAAEACPDNFLHHYAIVSAESARIDGDTVRAMTSYQQAIRSARDAGFTQIEAIAYELASRFYRQRDFIVFADAYLREARGLYLRWGAEAKVKALDARHPEIRERPGTSPTSTIVVSSEQIDLASVMQASQAIAKESGLAELVGKLVEVVVQQAGAQIAFLIVVHDGVPQIEAAATVERSGRVATELLQSPALSSSRVPRSVLSYVLRTKESLVLDDAKASRFNSDPYLRERTPRSVLCLPILKQGDVVALLYLENNLVVGAFTKERLAVLELLAGQVASSLENAMLLARERAARAMAQEAEQRASFLADASRALTESLDVGEIAARLTRLTVGALATFCVLGLKDEGAWRRPLSGAHRDPGKEALLARLLEAYPKERKPPQHLAHVVETGGPLLISEITDELLRSISDDDETLRAVRALDARGALIVPLVARGTVIGLLAMASDTPGRYGPADVELAQALASRGALAIDNARLYRDAQRAIAMREEFLVVASHELRTPLAALTLSVDALLNHWDVRVAPPRASKVVGIVRRQLLRLNRLVAALLDVSRIQADGLALRLEEGTDLAMIVRDVLSQSTAQLSSAGCEVKLIAPPTVQGCWDSSRLEQAVMNLVSNAITFGKGSPIEVELAVERGTVQLAVTDHGIGIDPSEQTRIFDRFARGVSARHYGGLGLGLYVTRAIAEAHGGLIHVNSALGRGSTFTLEIPLATHH